MPYCDGITDGKPMANEPPSRILRTAPEEVWHGEIQDL